MAQWKQADAIKLAGIQLDDSLNGKQVFQYRGMLGEQDGQNVHFQIPQPRIVPTSLIISANGTSLRGTSPLPTQPRGIECLCLLKATLETGRPCHPNSP
jgi:hypothetical protein